MSQTLRCPMGSPSGCQWTERALLQCPPCVCAHSLVVLSQTLISTASATKRTPECQTARISENADAFLSQAFTVSSRLTEEAKRMPSGYHCTDSTAASKNPRLPTGGDKDPVGVSMNTTQACVFVVIQAKCIHASSNNLLRCWTPQA